MPTAKSAFTVEKRDAVPVEGWQGGNMSRTRFEKSFTGQVAGKSVVEAIMLGLDDNGPMVYVGIERFDCSVDGRTGTFLLLHSASAHGSTQASTWSIVAGSGTGELTGIHGAGEILPKHDFVLTYEIAT